MIDRHWVFFNRSWNEDELSPYVILNALSCKKFVLSLRPLLWNIQAKGQYPNWDNTYTFITVFFFFQGTWMEQLLLMRLVCDLVFYRGCLCDLQKRASNPKLYLVAHSFQIWWSPILVLTLFSPENSKWLFPLFIFI